MPLRNRATGLSTAEAIEFDNALVASQKGRVEAASEFGTKAAKAFRDGSCVDLAVARREHESALETMDRVHSDVRIVPVPESDAARRYHEEFKRSLAVQDELFRKDLGAMMRVIQDESLAPRAKSLSRQVIAARIDRTATRDFESLKSAQAQFARAHRFSLK
jgi:hypothetical protein